MPRLGTEAMWRRFWYSSSDRIKWEKAWCGLGGLEETNAWRDGEKEEGEHGPEKEPTQP